MFTPSRVNPFSFSASRAKEIRAYGATRLYTISHELPALTALAQHISHSHSGIDEKRPTKFFVIICVKS